MTEAEYIKELEDRLAHAKQELLALKSAANMAVEELNQMKQSARAEPDRLRDIMAMSVLQGLITHYGAYPDTNEAEEQAASQAYRFADALMKARDIRRTSGQSD